MRESLLEKDPTSAEPGARLLTLSCPELVELHCFVLNPHKGIFSMVIGKGKLWASDPPLLVWDLERNLLKCVEGSHFEVWNENGTPRLCLGLL